VLILTGLDVPGYREAAVRAGADGFLLKDGPAGELIDAVRAVARRAVYPARLAGQEPGDGGPGAQA
jgi:two-component system response regulator DesR